jgi:hypothetical protein
MSLDILRAPAQKCLFFTLRREGAKNTNIDFGQNQFPKHVIYFHFDFCF